MITIVLLIAVCIWAWSKYKKTPTVTENFFATYRRLTTFLVIVVVLGVMMAYGTHKFLDQASGFLMHDWVADIASAFGLGDLYSMYQEYGDYSGLEEYASRGVAPLRSAANFTAIAACVIIGIAMYIAINIKQRKYSQERYVYLGMACVALLFVSIIYFSKVYIDLMYYALPAFMKGDGSESIASMILSVAIIGVLTIPFFVKYKKDVKAISEEETLEEGSEYVNEMTKQCPYCGETILAVAKKCKHCGEWLPETPAEETEEIKYIECPICGEDVEAGTAICPHCHEPIE